VFCSPHVARVTLLVVALLALPIAAGAAKIDCRIEGIDDEDIVKNIEATLSIVRDKDRDDLTKIQIEQLHERAPLEIQKAVEPFGFYSPHVDATLTRKGNDKFVARYLVTLGKPIRVRDVSVSVRGEGRGLKPFPDLVANFPLRTGDVLDQRSYTRQKTLIATAAADSGFLDAKFTANVIRIRREEGVADIELTLNTGPRYQFGPITFDSSAVDERVLRSYLTFKPGEPFRYHELLAFQSALGGTPYFSQVEAVPRRDLTVDNAVPIHVKLSSRRPRRYEVGVGYGTDTGPRVLLNMEFRRLNRAGHRLNSRLNLSEVEISLNAEYLMPSRFPDIHTYSIGAVIARIDPVSYNTLRLAVGPTRSQKRFGWLESLTLSYERENYTVGPDDGISDLIILGATYRLKRANDDISPSKGYRIDFSARGADQVLLSSQSFFSVTTTGKMVRTPSKWLRVIARVDAGWTTTSMFRQLPPTVRYFAGGDNSIRGYEYQSLGPRAEDGKVIGGDWLLTTSAELEFPLVGKISLAGFYDAGNAFSDVDEGTIEQGAGAGLRWRSPVGPLRLDFAVPLRHDGWRIHFTMGPDL
jgi:translocation and assembly module TamA